MRSRLSVVREGSRETASHQTKWRLAPEIIGLDPPSTPIAARRLFDPVTLRALFRLNPGGGYCDDRAAAFSGRNRDILTERWR